MMVLTSSLQIRLTCPSQINSPFLRAFASNFKFGKGLVGSLPFGGKSAWMAKFNIDACGLFFTISIVGSKFTKTLPLKFGEASMSFWLLASGVPPKTGANFIKAKTEAINKTMTKKFPSITLLNLKIGLYFRFLNFSFI